MPRLEYRALQMVVRGVGTAVWDVCGFLYYAGKRFYWDNYFGTAAALTYTALLAMVPLMTIVFTIFSAFPAFGRLKNQLQEMLFDNLVPQVGAAVLEYLTRFMENAGQSTAFGIVGLALSAVLLLFTIESAFGTIWRVAEPRPRITRFLTFWAILTLTPLLVGASVSASSTLFTPAEMAVWQEVTAPLARYSMLMPGLIEFMGFTFLYVVVPNRSVRWDDAAWGGLTAGILLEVSKGGFVWYMRSFPAYQTIYGALSTVPIFLLWLYIAWSTVLLGAVVTASLPEWRVGKLIRHGPGELHPAPRLAVALAVLSELMAANRRGGGARRRTLVDRVPVGSVVIEGILEQLRDADWVDRTTRNTWVVTRDLGEVTLYDLYQALGFGMRGSVRDVEVLETSWRERCAMLLDHAEARYRDNLAVSIRDLLTDSALPALLLEKMENQAANGGAPGEPAPERLTNGRASGSPAAEAETSGRQGNSPGDVGSPLPDSFQHAQVLS